MQNAHAMDSSGNVSFKWIKAFNKCGDGVKEGLILGRGCGGRKGKGCSILPGSLLEEFLPSPGSLSFVSFSSSSATGVSLRGPSASSLGSSVQKGRLVSRIGTTLPIPPKNAHSNNYMTIRKHGHLRTICRHPFSKEDIHLFKTSEPDDGINANVYLKQLLLYPLSTWAWTKREETTLSAGEARKAGNMAARQVCHNRSF